MIVNFQTPSFTRSPHFRNKSLKASFNPVTKDCSEGKEGRSTPLLKRQWQNSWFGVQFIKVVENYPLAKKSSQKCRCFKDPPWKLPFRWNILKWTEWIRLVDASLVLFSAVSVKKPITGKFVGFMASIGTLESTSRRGGPVIYPPFLEFYIIFFKMYSSGFSRIAMVPWRTRLDST